MESNREQRDRKLFNAHARDYSRKDLYTPSRIARRRRLRQTLSLLPLDVDVRILEVGCGAGFSARYLEGLYSEFVGIDYAENLIACARKHNSSDHVNFISQNVKDYRPDELFDVVLMIGVLHHFDRVGETLAKLKSLVRPGGWIVANEPQARNLFIQLARKLRGAADSGYSSEQVQFRPDELRDLYQEAGLEEVMIAPQGVFSTPFAEVVLKPEILFLPMSRLCSVVDDFLEKYLGGPLAMLSWNVIAAGRRPRAESP